MTGLRTTQVELRPVFTCAGCGGQFTESHCCPSMPWGNTGPQTIYIRIPQFIVYPTRLA